MEDMADPDNIQKKNNFIEKLKQEFSNPTYSKFIDFANKFVENVIDR